MAYTIFLTEDDDGIRETVQMALSAFAYEVRAFVSAEETLEACKDGMPDLFIFDIMLPGMDGIAAVRRLRARPASKASPVLFLTARDTEMDKVTGLDAGADDYLAKPFSVMELAARVRALLRRTVREDAPLSGGGLSLDPAVREVRVNGQPVALTYKEFELLHLLMENRDRVVPREELLDHVWGIDFAGETRTLDTHIKSLRQKLGDSRENPRFIATVRHVGYRFCEAASAP